MGSQGIKSGRIAVSVLAVAVTVLLFASTGAAVEKTFNSSYNWQNALDYSGVTWDGIQDHASQPTLQQGYRYGSLTEGLVGYWNFDSKVPDRNLFNGGGVV